MQRGHYHKYLSASRKSAGKDDSRPQIPLNSEMSLAGPAPQTSPALLGLTKKEVCVHLACVSRSRARAQRSIPTRLKERCPEVGCPFPTGSPCQWLEIPLRRTKRPDMIPQHCRQGRERRGSIDAASTLVWESP